ncbi:MAG: iron hydrogenase small subunit [Burkholderiales bacterium]|nr:iron hydrogenase small subunit [Burkholderiales bacterium]
MRGIHAGIKTAEIPNVGQVAICNGIAAAQRMFATETWRDQYVAIEVMACVGGCLGGGGEPKSLDPMILTKRMQAVYDMDKHAVRRRSYENPDVQHVYASELHHPYSAQAHALLHTSYAARHSKRLLLMQFLDCVDRRDGDGAANLFHSDGLWATDSPFGTILGASNIKVLINTRLPPRMYGPSYTRHRMLSSADEDDLTVIAPNGEKCQFDMDADIRQEANQARMLIKKLTRKIL